uniref:DUF4283 domain-containing protein n=1 Tax=Tanacetum cinerariifolium TaxID=118510 RepID=A0A6L2KN39_TANCI|nr:hypothetical protein [Tanacetum cinerariifolium]
MLVLLVLLLIDKVAIGEVVNKLRSWGFLVSWGCMGGLWVRREIGKEDVQYFEVYTGERLDENTLKGYIGYCILGPYKRGFLSQNGSGRGKGVKEKSLNASNIEVVIDGVVPSVIIESGNVAKKVVSPPVVDETVAKEKQSPLVNASGLGSYPPLPTQETTSTGNALDKSLYANVTGKPSGKKVNFYTLFTPRGNGIDVVVPVESIRAISERFVNTAYGVFLGKRVACPVVANYVRNTWDKYGLVRSMFSSSTRKWHSDVNLLKEDVGIVSVWVKLHVVPVTAFSEDGLSAIATKLAMIELRADVELNDNIVGAMPKITREGYYTCNIHVEYEWKPFRCACCKVFGHVQEECSKNIGTGETNNLKKTSQTPKGIPVGQKIGFRLTKQVCQLVSKKPTANTSINKKKNVESAKEGKVTLVDDEGKPLEKVSSSCEYESEDEWTESYENDDYGYDPYDDDDMYEGHDIPDKLQAICDKLDITAICVRCWLTNRIRGFGQLGKGHLHMGRSGRGHGYCLGSGEVHRKGWAVKASNDLIVPSAATVYAPDVVSNKREDVVNIEKLGKNLENASSFEIMDRAHEKYKNDIDIAIAFDQKRVGRIMPGRRVLCHCPKGIPLGVGMHNLNVG